MRHLIDPETGEMVEVIDETVLAVGTRPYDYADAKRVLADATVEKRRVLREWEAAVAEKAEAEKDYAILKGAAMVRAREAHGATMAEDVAKGEPEVAEALGRREKAREMVRVWGARVTLGSEDRTSLHRLVEWSMKSPGAVGDE